jgi:uncharacterized UBP type Zn finger protein
VPTTCEHLESDPAATSSVPPARTPEGCEECLANGGRWVHLRLCTSCGHVGCCDSSPSRHASAHHGGTGHPVVRSFEPGETWRWCYLDRTLAEV